MIYLKVVNEAGTAQPISIQINGCPKIQPDGEAVCLAASSSTDTNSIEQPQKIVPHTAKVGNLSANFAREFPPYSITILKVKTK